mgnify:CR=1 FL=1|jgi:hypothetical protein
MFGPWRPPVQASPARSFSTSFFSTSFLERRNTVLPQPLAEDDATRRNSDAYRRARVCRS